MIRKLFHAFAACALLLQVMPAQTVQLADGRVLVATIDPAEVDGEGLTVKRLDNDGVLRLRWDQLSSASSHSLKRKFSLIGDTQEELVTRAEEVTYVLKGSRQTVIGRIVDRTPTVIRMQAKGIAFDVPADQLVSVRTIEVPVMQVFTRDEYYQDLLTKQPPGDDADKHVLLAETLRRVGDYENADLHLKKAKELGNTRDQRRLDASIANLQRFKEAAKEAKLLEGIRASRSKGQLTDFENGTKLIAQFEQEFPQPKLKAEFDSEKKLFGDLRTKFMTGQVAENWRRLIQAVAEKKVAEPGLTLQAAREYAESKMTEDLIARVAAVLRLDPAEVKQLWESREKYPVGKRAESFAYGLGSWVLGEKAILKDTDAGKAGEKAAKDAPQAENQSTVQQFAKALQKAMENRQKAQAAGGEEKPMTEDRWWNEAERLDRVRWLRAYYAEFGGQLKVVHAYASPCISCAGVGTTPDMAPDGKPIRAKCFLCQEQKWTRSFKAY